GKNLTALGAWNDEAKLTIAVNKDAPLASLDELAGHEGIVHFSGRTGRAFEWEFQEADGLRKVAVKGGIAINDADANLILALQGL
ncbi:hypothetical protein PAI99_08660, partial [Campylobacter jejuni]|nr:hypothetical protein [Campylobacter jejuni]